MDRADTTNRFSDRVENYVKYRPSYPNEVIAFLEKHCNLPVGAAIADIGSGTGIFTGLLLNRGYKIYAVEPSEAMQQAAINQFNGNKNFVPINGTAEATALPANCIDLIVCAQAFHWFDSQKTKAEFKRILKNDSYVALIWNNRNAETDNFAKAYEHILKQRSVDYNQVNHRNINDVNFRAFFKGGNYDSVKYPNAQAFDEEGFLGRAFSSSYVPAERTAEGKKIKELLEGIFTKYKKDGMVSFYYDTEVYVGQL